MMIIIFVLTILAMMCSLIYFPKIYLFKMKINTHWIVVLIGAVLILLFGISDFEMLKNSLISNESMNPLKLIVMFICITIQSLFLDKLGFFKFIAYKLVNKIKGSQIKLFILLYLLTAILTVFTSNDVIILTFTPLVIYFCRNAKINSLPYLFSVLTAANTWSIMLLIGNPTNLYLGTVYNIDFIPYFKVMWMPAIVAGVTGFFVIRFIFRKTLKEPLVKINEKYDVEEPILMYITLLHIISCIILIALSNLVKIEMWIASLAITISLTIVSFIYLMIKKKGLNVIKNSYLSAPWSFIPMIISMFILVQGLSQSGYLVKFANFLNQFSPILSYGFSSHLASNFMNNQPMSMLYAEMIVKSKAPIEAVYATIIGSNTAVLFTPFGALAGLMWFEILEKFEYKLTLRKYIKVMIPTGAIVLIFTLLTLAIVLYISN